MKKIVYIVSCFLLAIGLTACGSSTDNDTTTGLKVVTTNFPGYDFARAVIGDSSNIKMLTKPGQETHSYDPTPQDIIAIEEADVFIYTGGHSDTWVSEMLETIDNEDLVTIKMMDLVTVVEEEIVEGMEDDHTHEHTHSHDDDIFADSEVKDRALTDWQGDWQSVYPYLLDGTLDTVMQHKAEEDTSKTQEEYYQYYQTGYETDVERITIDSHSMTFYRNGEALKSNYEYKGFEILTYESGSKGVRYLFEATDENTGAPKYVQFSDHDISPDDSDHYHIYFGDESFAALLEEMDNWPTYYPASLSANDIVEEMLDHDHDHEEEDHDHEEYDEHVWTAPQNATAIVQALETEFTKLDADNASTYEKNSQSYQDKIKEVDTEIKDVVNNSTRKELVFGDRFPFRYFVDQYGLSYAAAFPGCSEDTEASAQTITYLIDKIKTENIPVVFHIELSNKSIAETISEETGAKLLQFHSAHNVSEEDFNSGKTYVDIMQENVKNLKEALQ